MQYQTANPYSEVTAVKGAGVGVRFLATLIDGVVLGIIGYVLGLIFGTQQVGIASGISFLIGILYYIVLEATQGATLGKMALGLRIVNAETGAPIGWGAAVIRTVLRIVDGLFAYLIAAIFVWSTQRNQRLGDLAAHTVVVKK